MRCFRLNHRGIQRSLRILDPSPSYATPRFALRGSGGSG